MKDHPKDYLSEIRESVRTRFEQSKRVLSFDEFLELTFEDPYPVLRNSAHYVLDAIESFGQSDVLVRGRNQKRYKIFDNAFAENPTPIVGQENVQNQVVQILTSFVRTSKADKLVVLHGPNGSAKSSLIRTLCEGLETYSHTDAGRTFHFSWIFPEGSLEKSGLGIGAKRETNSSESFAKLEQERIGAIVRSELHENPLFLIPRVDRKVLFEGWLKAAKGRPVQEKLEQLRESFLKSELGHKNALIFEALLADYNGDFKKVLRHVRVERFTFSKRFRRGLVSIEPQFGVDAGMRQVTLDRSMANLPPALQSLNLFQLEGDLVDGNRGLIEYNDFLKRPLEHFKYLLGTCESGSVNLSHVMVFLDSLFVATTNDRQLEAFREHPEYNSFKARLELIKVPYLLRYNEEDKIYRETARRAAGPKELLPNTTKALALWAVLTRLKRPLTKNKSPLLVKILEGLSPVAKAKLYDSAELPPNLSDEERRDLRNHVEELATEHQHQPYYEGLLGASARELKVVLQLSSQNDQFPTLGPPAIFSELRKLVKRPMDFEYLRQEAIQGYHDFEGMIDVVRQEWLNWVDREMKESLELQSDFQLKDLLANHIKNITAFVRGEKIKNRHTGANEEPEAHMMQEFEELVGMSGNSDEVRRNIISRLGAWSIENPGRDMRQGLPYDLIFPDLMEKLRNRFHEKQVAKVKTMGGFILDVATFDQVLNATSLERDKLSEGAALAVKAYTGLQQKYGYGPIGAKEALVELIKSRYVEN